MSPKTYSAYIFGLNFTTEKKRKSFFFKRDFFKKNSNNLTRIKNSSLIYWQIQRLELISGIARYYHEITVIFSTQFLQYIIVLPFKGVHNYRGMLL